MSTPSTRESALETYLNQVAQTHGIMSLKFVSPNKAGVPDRILISRQATVFVELKAPHQKPRSLQHKVISQMTQAGALVFVVDSKTQIQALITALARGDMLYLNHHRYQLSDTQVKSFTF